MQWAAATLVIWGLAAVGVVWVSSALIDILKRQGVDLDAQGAITILAATALFGVFGAGLATYVLVRRDAVELARNRARIWTYVVLGLLPVVVLVVGFALYRMIVGSGGTSEAGVTILLTSGVIGLLFALAVVAVFFNGLALTDREEALGLPKGSVRAVIALALILIFAVLSVYLYSTIDSTNAPKADIAKQLITTVSTLVVAISSFYFGSSAVQQATATVIATQPSRRLRVQGPPNPSIKKQTDGSWSPAALSFTVQADPGGGSINGSVAGDEADTLTNAAGTWTYRPKNPTNPVTLRFAFSDDQASAQEITITVDPGDGPGGGSGPISGSGGAGTGGSGAGGGGASGTSGAAIIGDGSEARPELVDDSAAAVEGEAGAGPIAETPTPEAQADRGGTSSGPASTEIGEAMDSGL
jgi:uncharacterized membrane protein YgcG